MNINRSTFNPCEMKKPRNVVVGHREQITPNMLRVTLAGDALADFPTDFEGGYVKLALPDDVGGQALRSFTVRRFDRAQQQLTIDMVAHGDTGPAGRWAKRVKVGDGITIVGPGPVKGLIPEADWFLLAGDMSALPAISVNLAALPANATGHAVIEVINAQDRLPVAKPEGIELTWVVNDSPLVPNTHLEDAVKILPWRAGRVAVWVAGEYTSARALRRYIRAERQVPREDTYISCYWKIGDTDEQMKAAKRADPEGW